MTTVSTLDTGPAAPVLAALTADSAPRIGAGFRLQWEPAQQAHVLLYPEGMVKLNRSAGEIMTRCDGVRSIGAIAGELEHAFATQDLLPEVLAFAELAVQQCWLLVAE